MKRKTLSLANQPIPIHDTDHSNNQLLADQIRKLEDKLTFLQGALSVLGIVVTIVGGLGVWRMYEYSKFEAARDEVYASLVSQFREQTSSAINKLTVTEGSDDQKTRIAALATLHESLVKLKITNKDFSNTGELVTALKRLVIENKELEARTIVADLANNANTDPFIKARAIALRELILIAANRNDPPANSRKELLKAIDLDGTVALAFNGLGIVSTADAKQRLSVGNLDEAMKLMDDAETQYGMAAELDASALGTYKAVNNRIWSLIVLSKWCLERGPKERSRLDEYLRGKGYESVEVFFTRARAELLRYESLAPDLPVALETTAQISFVRSLYIRSRGDIRQADLIIRDGHQTFLKAIGRGLYRRVSNKETAKNQFDGDPLHSAITRDPPYAALKQQIHDRIDAWYSENDR